MKTIRRIVKFFDMWTLPVSRELRNNGRNSSWQSAKLCWGAADSFCKCRGI